ncbi:hypothetical protein BZA77DRAFT_361878 [Pyronema omphalodes]|nr:hypothetical protein BZA77DRAFT_361878 [Pyronema omphalodes]
MVQYGRGRVEEMGDRPGEVASERTGLLGSDDARWKTAWRDLGDYTPTHIDSCGAYPVGPWQRPQVLNINVVLAGLPVPSASTDQPQATTTRLLYMWRRDMIHFILEEYGACDEARLDRALEMNHLRISPLTLLCVNQDNEQTHRRFDTVEEKMYDISDHINDRFDGVLAKLNDLHGENAKLRAAYNSTQAETAALKAAVAALTKKIDEQQQVILVPASPNLTASSSAMEEMTMQLSVVQHDIQDVLDTVRNPPGKRKRRGSDQNTEPTSPTNRRPANHKPRATSPVRSMMHSKHVTTAAQAKLDALKLTSPLPLLAIRSTEATPAPHPDSSSAQNMPLPGTPSTAPAETNGWKTVEAKATQKKKMKAKETTSTSAIPKQTPTTKNGGRGKNTHQPRQTTPSAKKTWAEVVKSGGINVQIVLGNGNLGLTTAPARRGERRGGSARRLRRKEGQGERGEEKRGRVGRGVSQGKESGDTRGGVERGEESGGAGGPAAV